MRDLRFSELGFELRPTKHQRSEGTRPPTIPHTCIWLKIGLRLALAPINARPDS